MVQRLSSARLVERKRELEGLCAALDDASDGRPSVAVVAGEGGIGKSRLMSELEIEASGAGVTVLRGDCVEFGGAGLPYAPVAAALRDVAPSVLADAWKSVPQRARREVERTFPHIALDGGVDEDPPASDGYAQARLYESLFALLRALSEHAPLLLIVEDLHWADRSTRDFVEFLARNLRRERVVVAITFRTDELGSQNPVSHLVSELRRLPAVRAVDLDRLSRAAVAEQIADILGDAAPVALIDDVYERSGGNPFFVEELLASWRHRRVAVLPASLTDALLARYRRTSVESQRLLQFAAAMRGSVDTVVLGEAAEVPPARLSELLRECAEQHLLCRLPEADTFGFRHEAVRQTIYCDLLAVERPPLHLAIARTLAVAGASHAELAFHWCAAGRAPEAMVASIEAALEAERAHAFGAALDHFETALRLWTDEAATTPGLRLDRFDVLAHASDLAKYTGNSKRACELCDEALNATDPSVDRYRAAAFYERRGRCESYREDAGLQSYREALRLTPAEHRADRARLMSEEGLALTMAKRWDEALERCAAALDLALHARSTPAEGYARMTLGLVRGYAGDPAAGRRELLEARRLTRSSGRTEDLLRTHLYLAEVLRLEGDVAAALSVALDGQKHAHEAGMDGAFGHYMSLNAAFDLFFLGRWEEAATRLDAAAGVNLEPWDALMREQLAGQLALARGELETAQNHLDCARRLYRQDAPPEYAPDVYAPLAELALARGRDDDARASVAEGLAELDGSDRLHAPMLFAMAARVEADIADREWPRPPSDVARIGTLLDRLLDAADARPVPPIARAYQAVCRGETARAAGDASVDEWRQAADAWLALSSPYPAAYASWRHADALLLAGRGRREAARILATARAAAERLHANPLARRIEELAALHRLDLDVPERPARVPTGDAATSCGLTPRELEVLVLIAQGLSNREIADALVISQRTADVHASRVFAKLGVHNRVAAVAAAHRVGVLAPAP